MFAHISWAAVLALVSLAAVSAATLNLTVDLDYAVYRGVDNTSSGLVIWKGIRYAAPPTSKLRWQAPQPPVVNRTAVTANNFGPRCPQAMPALPGAPFVPGDEDCLYLNVFAPANATARLLPVLIVIHGGGYGLGDATMNMSGFVNANGNSLVVVTIQYRVFTYPLFPQFGMLLRMLTINYLT